MYLNLIELRICCLASFVLVSRTTDPEHKAFTLQLRKRHEPILRTNTIRDAKRNPMPDDPHKSMWKNPSKRPKKIYTEKERESEREKE